MSLQDNHKDPVGNHAAISVQNLCVAFGENLVVDHVSFAVPKGAVSAVIGPNGSGKTTLVRALIGLQSFAHGSVTLFGQPLGAHTATIGYVPQYFAFDRSLPMTCEEFLQWISGAAASEIAAIWKRIGLSDQVRAKLIGSLSGGQMQRLLIGQALLQKPDLLILDEPDANIDVAGERQLEEILKEYTRQGGSVVLISHDVSFVARAVEHVICLNKQLVCTGSPHDALTEKTLKSLFQNASLYHHH
jgi:ABC-type Mn2+/Zn2+ transport system ATPase subunit